MSTLVVATIRPLPGRQDEVRSAYEEVVGQVHENDEGCELYALHEGDDVLVVIEKWEGPEALAKHGSGPTMEALRSSVKDKVQGPTEVVVLEARPAGVPELGAL